MGLGTDVAVGVSVARCFARLGVAPGGELSAAAGEESSERRCKPE